MAENKEDQIFDDENRKKSPVRIIVTIVVVLIIIGATALGVMTILKSKKSGPAGMGGKGGPGGWGGAGGFNGGTVTSVTTVIAEPVTMHDFVTTNGNVETQTSVDVYPSIAGKVVQMNVSLGSKVKAGSIIGYVDPSAAGVDYRWSPITAPISGSIIQTPVKTGQQISAGTVVTKIGDIDNLQVSASVPERYVGYLKKGLKAEVLLEAYPDAVFEATVASVSPVLDSASRTKTVVLHFNKKDSRINAGMFAKVKLYTVDYPNAIAIQQDAVVALNDDYYLYVAKDDNTVEKRKVTLGQNVSGYYQILEGINPGDRVVVAGMLTLSDGSMIKDITNGVPENEIPADGPEGFSGDFPKDGSKPDAAGAKK